MLKGAWLRWLGAQSMASFAFAPVFMQATSVSLQARTEARGRIEGSSKAIDVEARPSVRLATTWRHGASGFAALYAPRLVLPGLGQPPQQVDVYNVGAVALDVAQRRSYFSLAANAGYGTLSTSSLLVQPTWNEEELPQSPTALLPIGDENPSYTLVYAQARAAWSYQLTRRLKLAPAVLYEANGGANGEARQVLPLVRGPATSVSLQGLATRVDTATTTVTASQAVSEGLNVNTNPVLRGELEQGWGHRFSRLTSLDAAAGVVVSKQDPSPVRLYCTALFALVTGFEQRSARARAVFYGRAFPWINSFSGDVEQRVEAGAAIRWVIGRNSLRLQVAGARALRPPDYGSVVTLVIGEAGFTRKLTRHVAVAVGVRAGWQDVDVGFRRFTTSQPMAFLALSIDPLPLRF